MAAFDIVTRPTSLTIKAGSTGSIMVVVSNRQGKPVMGLVEGTLTPTTAARWLLPPSPEQAQRRYEADPAATANLEFGVAVPPDAPEQDVQFKAIVRDVLAPDDTRAEGQTVSIKILPGRKNGNHRPKIPWWVWVVAAVVVLGAGVGIYLAVRSDDDEPSASRCRPGFVYRMANPTDTICVIPSTHASTQEENAKADERRSPTGGAYGPNTCLQGFVWREAYPGDVACVPVWSRSRAAEDNQLHSTRVQPPDTPDSDDD